MRAVYIMWLRQVKKYLRSKPRMLGAVGQPLLFLVALGFGLSPVFMKAGEGNYLNFLAPGVIGMSILFTSMFTGIEVIWDRQFGFLKETLVAPVSRMKIMLGKTLGGATIGLVQGVIVAIVSILVGFDINIMSLPLALVFMVLIAIMFTALGTAIASKLTDMHAFPLIMNFMIMPIFFLSGALFPIDGLPKALDLIAKVNPLAYGIDGLRFSLTGVSYLGVGVDLLVACVVALAILVLGTLLFERIEV